MEKQMSMTKKLASEFIKVLKYNPELTEAERVLSLEVRLDQLVADIERGCEETHKRRQSDKDNNKIIVDARPSDIQPLADMMLARQAARGLLN
jgi:hypothetical protein